jgi:hypothetical protein
MEAIDLRFDSYYRAPRNPNDMVVFLKLDSDGYWLQGDCREVVFDFPGFLVAYGAEIRRQFPLGFCGQIGNLYCQTGRWRRTGNHLELTSWDEQHGTFPCGAIEVVGPQELWCAATSSRLRFVPEAIETSASIARRDTVATSPGLRFVPEGGADPDVEFLRSDYGGHSKDRHEYGDLWLLLGILFGPLALFSLYVLVSPPPTRPGFIESSDWIAGALSIGIGVACIARLHLPLALRLVLSLLYIPVAGFALVLCIVSA